MIKSGFDKNTKEKGFASIDNDTKMVVFFKRDDGNIDSFKEVSRFDTDWHKQSLDIRRTILKSVVEFNAGMIK